ncbi:MAG TPA: hypothetical protein VHR86_01360, partial [Armatimonadota bacterium]|nr:hypothetical protein [Armatimonadota bacterium]
MSDVAVEPKIEGFARTFLLDRIVESLLQAAKPLKVGEILAAVQYEGTFTSRLLRAVLETSDQFVLEDRRWKLAPLAVENHRPLEAIMEQVVQQIGRPLQAEQIAYLLSAALERPSEVLLPSVQQVLEGRKKYFSLGDRWGLMPWLLEVDTQDADDVIFRNFFFDEEVLTAFREKLGGTPWNAADLVGSAVKCLQQAGEPVPGKVLQFFAWQAAQRKFAPSRFLAALLASPEVTLLSTGHWCSAAVVDEFVQTLRTFGEQLSEQEYPEEEEPRLPAEAIQVGEEQIATISSILSDEKSHRISEIIETLFELSPDEPDYNQAFGNVWGAIGADERFAWVGGERWRLASTLPKDLNKIPELLELPYLPYFLTEEGTPIDVELEESGFEGDLSDWVKEPRVMTAGWPVPEGSVPAEAPKETQAVVRYEHRLAGTLPIYGDVRALVPAQPDLVELTFVYGRKSFTGWLNNSLNLALDQGDLYDELDLPLCGGAFTLQPRGQGATTDFTLNYTAGMKDELVFLTDERLAELE